MSTASVVPTAIVFAALFGSTPDPQDVFAELMMFLLAATFVGGAIAAVAAVVYGIPLYLLLLWKRQVRLSLLIAFGLLGGLVVTSLWVHPRDWLEAWVYPAGGIAFGAAAGAGFWYGAERWRR